MASTSADEHPALVSRPADKIEEVPIDRQERHSLFDQENPDFITLGARTHDVGSANGYIEDVAQLAEKLLTAARKVWPTRNRSRYKDVRVLLLHWDEDDLGVKEEVRDLEATFRELYHYHTESWQIRSEKPDRELKKKILQFVEEYESEDTLLIVYYAGHARPNSMPGEAPDWVSRRKNATVVHPGGVQSILEECDSDVLLLYDCCHAVHPSGNTSKQTSGSITEVVAACGFEAVAAEVGGHSFTSNLTEVLAEALVHHSSQDRPFKVVDLHTQLISRLQSHKLSRQRDSAGKPLLDHNSKPVFEPLRRRTPIHYWLSSNDRSIILEPLETDLNSSGDTSSQADSDTDASDALSNPLGDLNSDSTTTSISSSDVSPPSSAPSATASYPMVVVSVRLASDEFEIAGWLEWLRGAPKEAFTNFRY
ncbi:hypothetical protein GQ53DRAFT_879199 [Thozetella sp. PMI_491]|nr:hypothetical protein GQ53DRAFT_879199 [Thozetella sp. PMI_491]